MHKLWSAPLQGATACKPFTVLFQAAGVAGQPRMQAVLSRSTAGLRTSMREGHGLSFSMPAARVPNQEPQQDELAPDEAELVNVSDTVHAQTECS